MPSTWAGLCEFEPIQKKCKIEKPGMKSQKRKKNKNEQKTNACKADLRMTRDLLSGRLRGRGARNGDVVATRSPECAGRLIVLPSGALERDPFICMINSCIVTAAAVCVSRPPRHSHPVLYNTCSRRHTTHTSNIHKPSDDILFK